jgi:hypothetical protein
MAANSSFDILAVSGFSRWGSLVKAAANNNLCALPVQRAQRRSLSLDT